MRVALAVLGVMVAGVVPGRATVSADGAGAIQQLRHAYYLFGEDGSIPLLLTSNPLEQVAKGRNEGESVLVMTYERDSVFFVKQGVRVASGDVKRLERHVRLQPFLEPRSASWYRYQEVALAEVRHLLQHPGGTIPVHGPATSRAELGAILDALSK